MPFPGLAHAAVTVSDLARSTAWYTALLGSEPVLDEDEGGGTYHHTVWVVGEGQLFGIHEHVAPEAGSFSPARVGLDHVAFGCADRAELETWAGKLTELGIDHDGIYDAHYGSGVSFKDPDGIALELFAPPAGA